MPLIAGVYGMLHDQITFSISEEYFTKFKYHQFRLEPSMFGGDRQTVAVIGFLATWWTGAIIACGLGLAASFYPDHRSMLSGIKRATLITLVITMICGVVGFFYGKYYLSNHRINWYLPENVIDRKSFIIVGSIHNSSYLGGLFGLVAGMIFLAWTRHKKQSPQKQHS
jgi:hypothetical protein